VMATPANSGHHASQPVVPVFFVFLLLVPALFGRGSVCELMVRA
jgi:hypothetical protein